MFEFIAGFLSCFLVMKGFRAIKERKEKVTSWERKINDLF
jgi:hypothetical protein